MKTLIAVMMGLMITGITVAQDIDEERMARDLKVAEDIIASLMGQSGNNKLHTLPVSGTYLPDYGVIFSIPSMIRSWPMGIKLWDGDGGHLVIGNKLRITEGDETSISGVIDNYEDYQHERDDYLESMMITFLIDYADLLGQLQPSDKILIKSEQRFKNVLVLGSGGNYSFNFGEDGDVELEKTERDKDCCDGYEHYIISAETVKSDLTAYRAGKLDREGLLDRISIEKQPAYSEKEPELELLSSIFQRLYEPDLSNTYFSTEPPRYNRIANFGVIYDWKVYSSNIDDNKHNMPTIDSYGLSIEDRNAKVEQLYPLFVDQFKQQLIEYGRTLKGLETDEILMFKVKLTQCRGCSIPSSIDFSVKKSVLEEFERQKISLGAATAKVKLQEHNKH